MTTFSQKDLIRKMSEAGMLKRAQQAFAKACCHDGQGATLDYVGLSADGATAQIRVRAASATKDAIADMTLDELNTAYATYTDPSVSNAAVLKRGIDALKPV